ncbi:hypothetical protein DY000_02029527 [Brassica cretica]|uniref:Uncharacterized protein n=1 Tax=Brassica cretica TaxID=69181 RepID=A0ABQ7DFJ8_BRACR|nr:hypothetical protein DY000_02029527 [Brassica cretica]
MEQHLATEYVSSRRKDCSFPTELTSLLLHRFGGKASVWVGRYLRVYQMKTLKYQVNPHDVSDQAANLTLARAIVSALVLINCSVLKERKSEPCEISHFPQPPQRQESRRRGTTCCFVLSYAPPLRFIRQGRLHLLYIDASFCGAVENNKSNKEASELKSAVLNANKAIFDAEQRVYDHNIRDLSVRVTNLSLSKSRLDEAIGSNDIIQILAAIQDMEHQLAIEYVSSRRNDCSFPTELTSLLLQRFGGQASVWVGRYLRVYQMKTLKYQVNPHDVSDQAANLTLARAIFSALVLSLVIYL